MRGGGGGGSDDDDGGGGILRETWQGSSLFLC